MEIRCQIIFIKHRFWKIHELETFGTRKIILGKKLEGCSCPRKRPVVFWTFHTFPCIFSRELRLVAVHGWFAIETDVWKVQNTAGRFLAQLHPSNFFLKILFLVPKVFNSWIFQKQCFMKIIWHRISIQTLLFQACLPTHQNGVENRDKAYYFSLFCGNHPRRFLDDNGTENVTEHACVNITEREFASSFCSVTWIT